jgi:hypothetical protein
MGLLAGLKTDGVLNAPVFPGAEIPWAAAADAGIAGGAPHQRGSSPEHEAHAVPPPARGAHSH